MSRIFTNQLSITFIPTFLLWLFGYSTLFIDVEHSSDRFMGAGTSLLVIATLINALSSDLPKTSYLKLIDIWFLWHILNTFAIITYHILFDRLRKHFEEVDNDTVRQFRPRKNEDAIKRAASNKLKRINHIVVMAFPFVNGIFYGTYFYLSSITTTHFH